MPVTVLKKQCAAHLMAGKEVQHGDEGEDNCAGGARELTLTPIPLRNENPSPVIMICPAVWLCEDPPPCMYDLPPPSAAAERIVEGIASFQCAE